MLFEYQHPNTDFSAQFPADLGENDQSNPSHRETAPVRLVSENLCPFTSEY